MIVYLLCSASCVFGYFLGHAFGYNKGYDEGFARGLKVKEAVKDMRNMINQSR